MSRARRDTPGADKVVHLNNAGAALPPVQVTEAVIEHLRRESDMGGYEAAEMAIDQIEHTYDAIAFLQAAERTGTKVEVIDDDPSGQLSVTDLRHRLDDGKGPVKLVAVTHVPTHGGLVNPAAEIGAATREAGVLYLLDACQSIEQMPIDVQEIGCDLLSATGRKFLRGPRGTGFLYAHRGLGERIEPPFLDLHAATWTSADTYEVRTDARRFENWETNYAAKIGLGVAVDYALSWGLDAIEARGLHLAHHLRSLLAGTPGVRFHDQGERQCGIVTFTIDGVSAQEVQRRLRHQGVNVSVSLVDYARLDLPARYLLNRPDTSCVRSAQEATVSGRVIAQTVRSRRLLWWWGPMVRG